MVIYFHAYFNILSSPKPLCQVLSVEMSRTGAEDQSFSGGFVPDSVRKELVGPVFLVYYGPRLPSEDT